ncbi:MAG TPA: hypothetical protein VF268_15260 [Gammaproteobacteria bacterium]
MNAYRCFLPVVLMASVLATAAAHAAGAYDDLRGKTKSSVEAQHGQPDSIAGPVGDPPITRWFYEGFTVVFEYDHVVHAFEREPELENLPSASLPDRPDTGDTLTLPE